MANRLRFRSGQVELHRLRVDSDIVIEAGDLVYLDNDKVKPASEFPWDSDIVTTQGAFAGVFVGVAHQPSAEGETNDVSVDLSPFAVYEFDVDSAAYEFGETLGPDEGSSAMLSQRLVSADASDSVARAAESRTAATSLLRVQFASAYHVASANAGAEIG